MPTFAQLPAALDLSLVAGDEFTVTATFPMNLTGYTLTAALFKQASEDVVETPTLTVTPGTSSSTVQIALTEAQTTAIYEDSTPRNGSPTERIRWYLRWQTPEGYTRTILSGTARVGAP